MSETNRIKLLSFPSSEEGAPSTKAKALIFSDEQSRKLLSTIDRIAPTDVTVLVIGETGTGKELVARRIHEISGRTGPFVAFNCGSLNETLVEAELFGHESGAFTGAQGARMGWFEAANGGTLFLDEIGDMPLLLQVKLLRVLQERQVTRIGSRRQIPLDVRVIAATNVDLSAAVKNGRFRLDLYYRLNVASIRLLPLRQRRSDILVLADYFADIYREKLKLGRVLLSADARRALVEYDWPGNIRELENVIHYALIVCENGMVTAADLRFDAVDEECRQELYDFDQWLSGNPINALQRSLKKLVESDQQRLYETVERLLVTTVFDHCNGNQVRSARRLSISRNVFRAQLKRFDLLDERVTEPEALESV